MSERTNKDFRRAAEAWLRICLEMEAPHGAKTFAAFLFLHFNWERWRDTGVLDAGGHDGENGGLGFRAIRRGTRLNRYPTGKGANWVEILAFDYGTYEQCLM